MFKSNSGDKLLNHSWNGLSLCIIIALFMFLAQVTVNAASSTCTSSSNCTLREWLAKLREESSSLECSLAQLEKSTALLSKVNYSSTSMRLNQISKLKKSIATLKGEIEIINLTCSTFYGPDCNLTTPECDSKCISCSSAGQCSICSGNWDGPTCSLCKSGWNGTNCNIPICDSKCISCNAPGICSNCTGNWSGTTCSTCKSGWNGTLCNIPICDSKCLNCTSPGICSNCTGNWNGITCSVCKAGWNGTLCNIPVCDSKCISCSAPGLCNSCSGNWNGITCSTCKTGWSGSDCNTPICGSNCASCSAPNVCPTCKPGWYGSDCSSNTPPLILSSAQITKFTTLIMPNAQITSSKLLYKASRDGFSVSTFHSKCDNQGPTIVIIKATSGAIFGGYASVSWQSTASMAYVYDNNAFIFSLVSSTNVERFTKLTYQNGQYYKNGAGASNSAALATYTTYGPTFGGGHDLHIADNCNSNLNSYSNLCQSYCETTMTAGSTANNYLAGSFNFQVEDYEVYSL